LELGQALPELDALLGVADRGVEGGLADPSICAPMPIRPSFKVSIAIL
jgi:hypothetical protein